MAPNANFTLEDAKQLFEGTFYDEDPSSNNPDPKSATTLNQLSNPKPMLG
jgi:hypothetical protein